MKANITGTGSYLPECVVNNDDLSKLVDTSDEWIRTRTGIQCRRIAASENTRDMAVKAAQKAIHSAGISADDIDLIIVSTSTPDYAFPNCASYVQAELDAGHAECFDLSSACTGFLTALHTADAFIEAGIYNNVLIVCSEKMSGIIDWKDRSVCVLFGDGAGACVLTASHNEGILSFDMGNNGAKSSVLMGGERDLSEFPFENLSAGMPQYLTDSEKCRCILMNGQEVFKFAVRKVPETIINTLGKASISVNDVSMFILHQANFRIIEGAAKRLGVSMEKFPTNLSKYGNTSSASIPILLDELNREHKLCQNDIICLAGFGAGLSWGSCLVRWQNSLS